VAANALEWMREARHPFLVRLSILQPHTPVLPPARFVQLYADRDPGLPEPLPDTLSAFERRVAQIHQLHRMPPEKLHAARLHYYAQVAWVDTQVGRVLDFLAESGREEGSIVLFGADHGNPIGDTWAFGKHTFTPTVHRVPQIVSWPGTLPTGQVREDICDSLDVARTLFGLAGIAVPASFKGRDLFADPAPEAVYATIGYGERDSKMGPNGGRGEWYGGRGWPRRSCVRTARYRLDKNMRLDGARPTEADEDIFLADVQADPSEFVDLASAPQYAPVVKELCAKLEAHAAGAVDVPHACLVR
jgi:choline-sulfatase